MAWGETDPLFRIAVFGALWEPRYRLTVVLEMTLPLGMTLTREIVLRRGPASRSKTGRASQCAGTMRRIADGENYPIPATIDDPAVLGQIEKVLQKSGYSAASGRRVS